MKEVTPTDEVSILTSYSRIFQNDCWDVREEDGEYIGTCDSVSRILFTTSGVVLHYGREKQFIPNHQMISMTW